MTARATCSLSSTVCAARSPCPTRLRPTRPRPSSWPTRTTRARPAHPFPGMVSKVNVKPGDQVKVNDVLAVIEAMKMETSVVARMDGTIDEVFVKAQPVGQGRRAAADDQVNPRFFSGAQDPALRFCARKNKGRWQFFKPSPQREGLKRPPAVFLSILPLLSHPGRKGWKCPDHYVIIFE